MAYGNFEKFYLLIDGEEFHYSFYEKEVLSMASKLVKFGIEKERIKINGVIPNV